MKILRSVHRRGFNLGSAGWFTVLKPNTWFAASRLRDDRHHFGSQSKSTVEPFTDNSAAPSFVVKLNANDPGLVRLALTVLGGVAITVALLWWIMSEAPPNAY